MGGGSHWQTRDLPQEEVRKQGVVGTGDRSRVAAERWAGGRGGRGPPSFLCPALLWVQMIESECFKDINESENEPVVVLEPDEKTDQQVPRQKRGFFYRLFSRGVRVAVAVLLLL